MRQASAMLHRDALAARAAALLEVVLEGDADERGDGCFGTESVTATLQGEPPYRQAARGWGPRPTMSYRRLFRRPTLPVASAPRSTLLLSRTLRGRGAPRAERTVVHVLTRSSTRAVCARHGFAVPGPAERRFARLDQIESDIRTRGRCARDIHWSAVGAMTRKGDAVRAVRDTLTLRTELTVGTPGRRSVALLAGFLRAVAADRFRLTGRAASITRGGIAVVAGLTALDRVVAARG